MTGRSSSSRWPAAIRSRPSGTQYFHLPKITGNTFGPVPVAYGKLVATDELSLQFGKLPTLIGAEYAFTFQNMNIERGLLVEPGAGHLARHPGQLFLGAADRVAVAE